MNDLQEEKIIGWFEEQLDGDCKTLIDLFAHLKASKILKWENHPFELSIINEDEEIEYIEDFNIIVNQIEYYIYEGYLDDLEQIGKFIQKIP